MKHIYDHQQDARNHGATSISLSRGTVMEVPIRHMDLAINHVIAAQIDIVDEILKTRRDTTIILICLWVAVLATLAVAFTS